MSRFDFLGAQRKVVDVDDIQPKRPVTMMSMPLPRVSEEEEEETVEKARSSPTSPIVHRARGESGASICDEIDRMLADVQSYAHGAAPGSVPIRAETRERLLELLRAAADVVTDKLLVLLMDGAAEGGGFVRAVRAADRIAAQFQSFYASRFDAQRVFSVRDADYRHQMLRSWIDELLGHIDGIRSQLLGGGVGEPLTRLYLYGRILLEAARVATSVEADAQRARGNTTFELRVDPARGGEASFASGCSCGTSLAQFAGPLQTLQDGRTTSKKSLATSVANELARILAGPSVSQPDVRIPCTELKTGELLLLVQHNVGLSHPWASEGEALEESAEGDTLGPPGSTESAECEDADRTDAPAAWDTGVVAGCVLVTNFRVIFVRADGLVAAELPVLSIAETVKVGSRRGRDVARLPLREQYRLDVLCKDMQCYGFSYSGDIEGGSRGVPRRRMLSTLILEVQRLPLALWFALRFGRSGGAARARYLDPGAPTIRDGWTLYNARAELARLGLPNSHWRISDANREYALCESYPAVLGVPDGVSDAALARVAEYRSKGRLQALSFIHPLTEAALLRCSQPRSGFTRRICLEDEELMREILSKSRDSDTLWIYDARPRANAMANTAKGAGSENMARYPGCRIKFLGIPNIHVMRDSLLRLRDACQRTADDRWLAALDASQWLAHIKRLLFCTQRIVQHMEAGRSVVCHCSDGWDRTSQLVALAQLLLDPYYRTAVGFCVLVEKEWLSFGHQFALRCAHDLARGPDDQRAPIFLQFLDCVFQILVQHPAAFEFSEPFLVALFDALNSCQFGTFLCNSERERKNARLPELTSSVWTVLLHERGTRNPLYSPRSGTLSIDPNIRQLSVWNIYFRHSNNNKQR